ncbi:MAG: NADH-quinone oxidoreductase subunit L [Sandaracinaceae bacterium]
MSFDFDIQQTLLWIVLLPLLGAVINGIAGRSASKDLVSGVAVGSVFVAFLLSLVGFGYLLSGADDPSRQALGYDAYEWFSINVRGIDVPVHVRFVMDHLSGIMCVMVSGIAALIHVYSVGYMHDDPGYARFMTYLNLFTASMLILVLASNVVLMFVGWEGVGLCSYLLIGFWFKNADYAAAGRKAFVVNRIGDFGVLIGMFLILSAVADARTPEAFEFAQINAVATRLGLDHVVFGATPMGITVATAAALFLFLGVCGKSAQFPLFVWLPDAMAGPTPVSALIHAATMVTAGVYLLCRLSPVFVESPYAMAFIATVGALTAFIAATIALVQNQMKKILAYSTVSQLGFMVAACGMGAFSAGFFHVFTHAFFKACLFLGAGSVMHAVHAHGDADIRALGGLRKKLPKTHLTFMIATAAIAGFPVTSGFFSKDEILLGALTWATGFPYGPFMGWVVFGTLVLAATLTAFYMFRLYFRTFWGDYKGGHLGADPDHAEEQGADAHGEHAHEWVEPHESPDTMTTPLYVLAAGALFAGLLGLPHAFHLPNWWSEWLTPAHERFLEVLHESEGPVTEETVQMATAAARDVPSSVASLQFEGMMVHGADWIPWAAMAAGLTAFFLGFGLAYSWYAKPRVAAPGNLMRSMPWLHRFLMDKWRFDELYDLIIVSPMKWLAVLAANLDRYFVDFVLTKATAAGAKLFGFVFTRAQNGVVFAYAGLFVLGLAVLGWWFTYPHVELTHEVQTDSIQWSASPGLGYEYRWDFDSDSEYDTEWSEDPATPAHNYRGEAYYALVAILEAPRSMFGTEEIVVAPGDDAVELPTDDLGPDWVLPQITTNGEPPDDGLFGRNPEGPSLAYEDGRLVVTINRANIVDRDGEDDGRLVVSPGESFTIGGGRVTVAVLVRGTVEVKNAFGNTSRVSEDVVLQVSPGSAEAEPQARAETGRTEAVR